MKSKVTHQQDYIKLVEKMIEYDKRYYDENRPLISDYEYDQLFHRLLDFEKKNPKLIHPESPTQRVSEALAKGFQKKEHVSAMLSLANTYSEEELKEFIQRVYRLMNKKDIAFTAELKIDGTAISLRYENKKLVRALTRGNGKVGDDVVTNVKTIKNLPLVLKGKDVPDILEIRGEVFMDVQNFAKLNKQRQEEGLETWANPRNAAAGSLKLLDSKEVAKRKLNILCYSIVEGKSMATQYETLHYLKKLNLPIVKEKYFGLCKNFEEIMRFAKSIEKARKNLPFEIDGIVVKVDRLDYHKKLGVTGKHPRYAAAFKFAPEQAFTKIKEITVQVGRTGVLTPVAELEPVLLSGSTISRATLHNEDEIVRKDIRLGDSVVIEKGGDVIPKIVKVEFEKRGKNAKLWKMPKKCPACQGAIVKKENEVAFRCVNPKCSAQRLKHIIFFASKQAMDIEHLGEKVVQQLVEKGLISRISDIYLLDENSLSLLEGFKEKSIQNLLISIEKSKKCSLAKFLMGLAIAYVGSETADILARRFKALENLKKASVEDLLEIDGIGEKVAHSIVDFFKDPSSLEEINLLLKYGVSPQKPPKIKNQNPLFLDKTFVLTGTLENYTRDEAKELIKQRGGKISSSVSKRTDYVLLGKEPGSKYSKAKKLNIAILSEQEFSKML